MMLSPVTMSHAPTLTTYSSAGTFTYTIPQWATHVDVIVVGGGGGGREGNGGNLQTGNGGLAGSWYFRTLNRGADITWSTATLTAVVGAPGPGGPRTTGDTNLTLGRGGDSIVSSDSFTLVGSGGAGGIGTSTSPAAGSSPGNVVVGGNTYTGGATAPSGSSRTVGNAPGGGGGGGAGGFINSQTAGMDGAPGTVYFYAYTKVPMPQVQFTDPLDSAAAFTVAGTGSGITFTGEAQWGGTSDGQGVALYDAQATTNNQYAAAIVGSTIGSRGSGLILHSDSGYTSYYGATFYSSTLKLVQTSGHWTQFTPTELVVLSMTIAIGDLIEFWNIGNTFKIAVNGTVRINHTINNPLIYSTHRYIGFGMYRDNFVSSTRISEWRGGDAIAWGKT